MQPLLHYQNVLPRIVAEAANPLYNELASNFLGVGKLGTKSDVKYQNGTRAPNRWIVIP